VKARKKPTLPDGTTIVGEITYSEEVFGNFGPQLALKLKVIGGKYAGYEFQDWSKLARDPKTNEVYVELGGKAADIFRAAHADEYSEDMDHDAAALVGKRIMARVGLAGKKQDRNKLEYGTIGADPGTVAA
jgi:hypothetical protein